MSINVLERVEKTSYTLEEYLEREETALYKSEYQNGKLIAMAGETVPHSRIGGNAYFYFRTAIKASKKNGEAFSNDEKIYLPELKQVVYADSFVVLGDVDIHPSGNQLVTNPTLVVEVLSQSTTGYDRGEKFRKYQTLPSFQEYVLIDQNQPIVDVLYKEENLTWRLKTYIGLEETLQLKSIGLTIKMEDLYENVKNLQAPQFKLPV